VKDLEVTDLLYRHGYNDDQAAYVQSLLKPSSNDLISWRLAHGHPVAEALCVAGRLKDILCATPIFQTSRLGNILRETESAVSYLPPSLSKKTIEVGIRVSQAMTGSTHQKVDIAAAVLCEELLEGIIGHV
jgi:hypothetical protein